MTSTSASSAEPRDEDPGPPMLTTSSTEARADPTPEATRSASAGAATIGLISPEALTSGGRLSTPSWLLLRIAHVFGRHEPTPFGWWMPLTGEIEWSEWKVCAICGIRLWS